MLFIFARIDGNENDKCCGFKSEFSPSYSPRRDFELCPTPSTYCPDMLFKNNTGCLKGKYTSTKRYAEVKKAKPGTKQTELVSSSNSSSGSPPVSNSTSSG